MAYQTGLLAITLNNVDETMLQVKGYVQNFRTASLAGPVGASAILDLFSRLRTNRQELATLAAVPGLAAYAREQKNNENFDIVAEFQAVLAAIDGVDQHELPERRERVSARANAWGERAGRPHVLDGGVGWFADAVGHDHCRN